MDTKENNSILKRRIFLFLIICFGMTWIYELTVIRNISVIKNDFVKQALSVCGMFFPLIAHLCA